MFQITIANMVHLRLEMEETGMKKNRNQQYECPVKETNRGKKTETLLLFVEFFQMLFFMPSKYKFFEIIMMDLI